MQHHDGVVVVSIVITYGYIFTTYNMLLQLVLQANLTSVPIPVIMGCV